LRERKKKKISTRRKRVREEKRDELPPPHTNPDTDEGDGRLPARRGLPTPAR
jgi:hypothetical protein